MWVGFRSFAGSLASSFAVCERIGRCVMQRQPSPKAAATAQEAAARQAGRQPDRQSSSSRAEAALESQQQPP